MASIADVYVTVLPETGKIADGIKKALMAVDDDVRDAAKRWKKEIETALKDVTVTIDADVDVDGRQVEKEVEQETRKRKPRVKTEVEPDQDSMAKLRKEVEGLLSNLEADVDETAVRNKLKKLQADTRSALGKVGVTLDERIAENQLRKLRSETARLLSNIDLDVDSDLVERVLGEFDGRTVQIEFDADPERLKGSLGPLYGMFAGKAGQLTVDVEADTSKAVKEIGGLDKELDRLIAAAERKLNRLTIQRDAGIDVDLKNITEAEAELELLTRRRTVGIETSVDHDLLAREAAEIATVLSDTMGSTFRNSFSFIGEQLGAITRLHPIVAAAGITVLAATIGDLIGVVAELSGGLALIPSVVTAAAAGIGTLALATDGFGDALKNMGDPDKFAVSLRELAPNAQQAALAIQAMMPQFDALKATLSQALFENVGPTLINTVNAILPAITPGLERIAGAFNTIFQQVAALLQDPETVAMISTMVNNIATAFELAGPAVGQFLDAFIQLASVGASFLPGFASGLSNAATTFANAVSQAVANGSLQEFIQKAVDAFNQLLPLLPALVDSFMRFAPIGEQILPGLVISLEALLAMLPTFAGVLTTLGPNFIMLEGSVNAVNTAFDWLGRVVDAAGIIWDGLKAKIAPIIDFFQIVIPAAVDFVGQTFERVFPGIGDLVTTAFNGIKSVAEPVINWLADKLQWLIDRINSLINNINRLPFVNIPSIPGVPGGPGTPIPPPPNVAPGAPGTPPVPTGPDERGMIPGTNLPWTNEQPKGTILPGRAGPQPAAPGQSGAAAHQNQVRGGAPVAPGMNIPLTPLPPSGGFPLPPLPEPKTSGGGGGGGGGGKKPEAVSPVPGAPYTYTGFGELDWDALAEAESGGNWSANTGNGYYGGLQFDLPTWNEFGGQQFAERPDLASKQEQIKVATALYNKRGAGPWPVNGWLLTANQGPGGKGSRGGAGGGYGGGGGGYGGYSNGRSLGLPAGLLPAPPGASALAESGLQPAALNAGRIVENLFPQIQTIGGQRQDSLPFHTEGRALDVMIPGYNTPEGKALGDQIMAFFQKNADALGVEDTIWQDFWQPTGGGSGKRLGRKGVTEGHYDHVHISFGSQAQFNNPAVVAGPGGGDYTYDGPGVNRTNPMYTQPAQQQAGPGEQLGKDIVSGIMEVFGFGDLFKDPTQFGLFKIFKAIMGVKVGQGQGQGQGEGGEGGLTDFMSSLVPGAGGGGGGGGLIDFITGLVPQPYGELKSGSPEDAPGEFIPGVSQSGGGGSLTDFITGLVPSAQQKKEDKKNVDNSFNVNIGDTKADTGEVMNAVDNYYLSHSRSNLNNLPR